MKKKSIAFPTLLGRSQFKNNFCPITTWQASKAPNSDFSLAECLELQLMCAGPKSTTQGIMFEFGGSLKNLIMAALLSSVR